jgi:hypothetical protein
MHSPNTKSSHTGKGTDRRIGRAVIRRFVFIREKNEKVTDSDLPFPAGITSTKIPPAIGQDV